MPVLDRIHIPLTPRVQVALLGATFLLLYGARLYPAFAQDPPQAHAQTSNNADLVARGKYLVEGVAGCADCHTPRDKNGELDHTRWLQGAPVFFQPAQPVPGWPLVAPRLAGLPPGSDQAILTLLTTGNWTTGKPPRQPMPRFRMTQSDAEAVLAYLKSLSH
jgi:mono/diheme cytochrome c family protein